MSLLFNIAESPSAPPLCPAWLIEVCSAPYQQRHTWLPNLQRYACCNNLTVFAAPPRLLSSPQASKWTCYMPHLEWYKYTTAVPMDILQDRLHCSVLHQYGSGAIKTRMPANWPQLLGAVWCLSFIISRLNLTWLKALCMYSIRSRLNLNWLNALCWVSINSRVITLTLSAVPYL
jgi:hypothetical protein